MWRNPCRNSGPNPRRRSNNLHLSFAKKLDRALNLAEKSGVVLLLSVMVGLSFLQVILRLLFSTSLLWADTFLRHLVLWAGLLGACVAASDGTHFALDILKNRMPEGFKKPLAIFLDLLSVLTLFILSKAACGYFKDDLKTESILFSVGTVHVLSAWLTAIIPACFVLLTLHFLIRIFSKDEWPPS